MRTLFESSPQDRAAQPLAGRVRPSTLADLVGQAHLVGVGRALERAIASDRVQSTLLWGPPGSGKTTLATIVSERTSRRFEALNAVLSGLPELREAVKRAREAKSYKGQRSVLFIDEIHRFNKTQQDALLPHVEDGTFTLIGATTENPSFSVVSPLLSRCQVLRLEPLSPGDITAILKRALHHPEGLAGRLDVEDEALALLASASEGDARRALTALEGAAFLVCEGGRLTAAEVKASLGPRALRYDRTGEEHHNVTSALIKSMRGSDPDAAVYYLMRMVDGGEDPLFILRRLIIFASEDVGNADPRALHIALDADAAWARLGSPEGLYALSQAVTYLACAPKSNAAGLAYQEARRAIAETGSLPVPMKLRNAPTSLMQKEGYGAGYRYAHDEPDGVARGETYLPEALVGRHFYRPTQRGFERNLAERLAFLRGEKPPTK